MSHHLLIFLLQYSKNLNFSWKYFTMQSIHLCYFSFWYIITNPRKIPFPNIFFMGGLKYMYWFNAFVVLLLCLTILNSTQNCLLCFAQ